MWSICFSQFSSVTLLMALIWYHSKGRAMVIRLLRLICIFPRTGHSVDESLQSPGCWTGRSYHPRGRSFHDAITVPTGPEQRRKIILNSVLVSNLCFFIHLSGYYSIYEVPAVTSVMFLLFI